MIGTLFDEPDTLNVSVLQTELMDGWPMEKDIKSKLVKGKINESLI